MNILGISAFYHDSAAALVRDGEIVAAAQEERFTRRKHEPDFPRNAVRYCLKAGGITAGDIDQVCFYDKPFIKFERLLETYLSFAPAGIASFLKAMPLWIKKKLWMGELIRRELGYEGKLGYTEHHQSHAASAFFPSPFQNAAFLTVDGVGEWATASWGLGRDNRIDITAQLNFPHSLGLLYTAFTYYLGFKVNSGEYKVMGLAPYGEPKFRDLILEHLIDLKDDGSFRLNMKFFNYCQGLTMTSPAFHDLFGGPPRRPESALCTRDMDLARSIQEVAELVMLKMARHVRRESGERNLCLAGGVALNCVGNGKILREKIFERIWIQPAAGDAGGALGAALFAWHQVEGQPRRADDANDSQKGSYLGPSYSGDEIADWLTENEHPFTRMTPDKIPDWVAGQIDNQKVIGWFCGPMEFGPRALGARSIIGDPRSPAMQSIINQKIKFRESFRPFAPSCLFENVSDYFELAGPSPYMLLVADVRKNRRIPVTSDQRELQGLDKLGVPRSDIPAVTHVDDSARIHTVDATVHPRYHELISAFRKRSGCGVLINTSFNVRGEPIVCTPQDAYLCFMRTRMDVLVMEDCVLTKGDQPELNGAAAQPGPTGNTPTTINTVKQLLKASAERKEIRNFALPVAVLLAAIGLFALWREKPIAWPLIGISTGLVLAAYLLPAILRPLYVPWMLLAAGLGWLMTRVVLTLTFYLMVTPLGLLMRIFGKDPLRRRFPGRSDSYWDPWEHPEGGDSRHFKPY